jgi:colanic acid biosynthesis glycosyl transferase WcaI
MGPVAAVWAQTMRQRGHEVEVVSAFPHSPPGLFRQRARPYRETIDGIPVLRLPLVIGHSTTPRRILEEASYALSAAVASPLVRPADAEVVVSPSFLALTAAALRRRFRRQRWVLWLQDVLPDAAATTGLMREGRLLDVARRLELAAYRSASAIVVISESFRENLLRKGVPAEKVRLVYNPATRGFREPPASVDGAPLRLLAMGNMGYSQGLAEFVRAFEASDLHEDEARLVVAGAGELADHVRAEIRTNRVDFLGFVSEARLEEELGRASLGLVSQRSGLVEFNLPSKLMNFMAWGLPILAAVPEQSAVGRIVRDASGGWVVPQPQAASIATTIREARAPEARAERGRASLAFARSHFGPEVLADSFERILSDVIDRRG